MVYWKKKKKKKVFAFLHLPQKAGEIQASEVLKNEKKSQYKHFKITICNYISQQDTEITLNMTKNKTISNRLILDSC